MFYCLFVFFILKVTNSGVFSAWRKPIQPGGERANILQKIEYKNDSTWWFLLSFCFAAKHVL